MVYITSRKSSINDFGIIEWKDVADPAEETSENFMYGIPAYHIREFFRMSGGVDSQGKLYVMFADCSTSWDAIDVMQRAAGGMINQLGVWTEQPLWRQSGEADPYNLNLVMSLNDKAEAMARRTSPCRSFSVPTPPRRGLRPLRGVRST